MTDSLPTEEKITTTPAPKWTFSNGINTLFQPTAQLEDLTKESIKSWTEILWDITQIGNDAIQTVEEFMTEPSKLFQPTKAVSTLWGLVKNAAGAGIEWAKDLATDTISLATWAVGDVVNIWKDIANIRTEPKTEGDQLFQPKKPIEELGSIWSKVIKSWVALAGWTVGAGVNVAKKVVGAGTNILKKWIWIFKKWNSEEDINNKEKESNWQ